MRIDLEIRAIVDSLVTADTPHSVVDAATGALVKLFLRHLDEELEHWDEEEQVDEFGRRLLAHEKCAHCSGTLAMWECDWIFGEHDADNPPGAAA